MADFGNTVTGENGIKNTVADPALTAVTSAGPNPHPSPQGGLILLGPVGGVRG